MLYMTQEISEGFSSFDMSLRYLRSKTTEIHEATVKKKKKIHLFSRLSCLYTIYYREFFHFIFFASSRILASHNNFFCLSFSRNTPYIQMTLFYSSITCFFFFFLFIFFSSMMLTYPFFFFLFHSCIEKYKMHFKF